jgi:hypothetical protein
MLNEAPIIIWVVAVWSPQILTLILEGCMTWA